MLIRPGFNQGFGFPLSGRPNSPPIADTGGGGGGAYVAKAVVFDGATGLAISSLAASNSNLCSVAYWIKAQSGDGIANKILWVVDPNGAYASYSTLSESFIRPSSFQDNTIFGDGSGTLSITPNDDHEPIMHLDTWVSVIGTIDTQAQLGMFYINDVISNVDFPNVTGSPFTIPFSGKSFKLCDDGFSEAVTCELADFRFMPGISLLDGGVIPEATRRLFIGANGKPVDPAVATAALGPTAILFSGDALSFGTNQGNGGASTLTGTMTNATTSPSD